MNRLLILDDNERFAEVLQRSISGFDNYESETVQYVTTSEVAIELVKEATELQSPFNVLLIDQNLEAEMDGIQVMKEMLSIHSDADTIIFTGYDTPEDGLRAYEAGASRYLPKPFEPEELEFVLKELMRSRKVRLAEARQRQQFRVATKIAEAVGASLNLEDTMDAVLGTLYSVFDKTRLCVLLYDERQNALRFAPSTMKYYEIKNTQYSYQDTFPLNAGSLACQAAQLTIRHKSMELVNVGDVTQDAEYLNLNPETKSECCVGLLNMHGELLGVLALEREWLNGFDERDLDLIHITARHISIAIERAHQSEELKSKSAIAAQTSWAAALAHELNNEVGKIANWAQVIQQVIGDDLPEIRNYAKNIEESAYYLSRSNPWSARSIKSFEIDQHIKDVLEKLAPKKSLSIEFRLNAQGAKVKVSPAQFQFILKQLAGNAARAMGNNEDKKVLVETQLANLETVEILFQDFGPGISEENRMAIFNWQFTTKETGGFGLLFVKQMIEDMNGNITLLPNQPGKGAAFLIHLPLEKKKISE